MVDGKAVDGLTEGDEVDGKEVDGLTEGDEVDGAVVDGLTEGDVVDGVIEGDAVVANVTVENIEAKMIDKKIQLFISIVILSACLQFYLRLNN